MICHHAHRVSKRQKPYSPFWHGTLITACEGTLQKKAVVVNVYALSAVIHMESIKYTFFLIFEASLGILRIISEN